LASLWTAFGAIWPLAWIGRCAVGRMAKIGVTFGILGGAVAGALLILMVQLFPLAFLETSRLDLIPAIWNTYVIVVFACIGFAFVFSGTIIAPKPGRTIASIAL